MASDKNNWSLGETVRLPREEKALKKRGLTRDEQFVTSRYLCIRQATSDQRGILLKVLGKAYSGDVKIIGGEPFCPDDSEEMFDGLRFFSYPFPDMNDVMDVLDILRQSPDLLQKLEDMKMHLNPNSAFWVRNTTRNILMLKTPQLYDACSGQLGAPSDNTPYYRITIVYFFKGELIW